MASTGSATNSGSRYSLREGKRKLPSPKTSMTHVRKEGNHGGAVEKPFLVQGLSLLGPLDKYHSGLEEGPVNSKLASSASIKGKKVIARARALQTGFRILERSNATPLSHSNITPASPNHGEPNQTALHDLQLATGGGSDSGYQFRGGELSNISPGYGAGKSQISEGVEGALSANGEEKQRSHDNIGRTGSVDRAPLHLGVVGEAERDFEGEDVFHGDQSDHNFDSNKSISHGVQYPDARSEIDDGNATNFCDINAEQGDRMQFEGGGEVSTSF